MCISSTVLWCTTLLKEREGQQCQSWVFTFWDFSAAPLSTAAISTKIKDPNGARPGGDERCRDGTLLWISNAAHVSEVMTGSQAPSTGFPASGPGNKGLLFLVTKHYGSNPMAHVLIGSGNHPEKVHKVWGGKKTTNLCLLWFSQWIDKKSAKKKLLVITEFDLWCSAAPPANGRHCDSNEKWQMASFWWSYVMFKINTSLPLYYTRRRSIFFMYAYFTVGEDCEQHILWGVRMSRRLM